MIPFMTLLERDRPPLGTWVKLPAVESVELMHLAGMDFVVLDLEHAPLSLETVSTLIAVASARGLVPLVRVPDHAPSVVQRCLDAGAAGIVAPHVDDVEEARALAAAMRFPPRGRRGVGPTSRAGDWGLAPLAEYRAGESRTVLVAQIESAAGVASVDAILGAGAVDALLVGPADLAVSLGVDSTDPRIEDIMLDVLGRCRAAGVPCGTAIGADAGRAADLADRGFAFVLAGNDATILGSGARALAAGFQEARRPGG